MTTTTTDARILENLDVVNTARIEDAAEQISGLTFIYGRLDPQTGHVASHTTLDLGDEGYWEFIDEDDQPIREWDGPWSAATYREAAIAAYDFAAAGL